MVKRKRGLCFFSSSSSNSSPTTNSSYFHFQYAVCLFLMLLISANSSSTERSTYIVHTDKSIMPKAFPTHHYWYSSIVNSLKSTNSEVVNDCRLAPSLVHVYDNALHGFSASLTPLELEELKKAPWFITSYMDRHATIDTTHTSHQYLSLNPYAGLLPAANHGENIIIGVVDGGIWPESESFKDHGMATDRELPSKWKGTCEGGEGFNSSMCNSKLIGVRYFNKGLQVAYNITVKKDSARDISGHGSHVASTAAGNYVNDASFFGYAKGTARGVAPRARLAAYKVSWEEGSLTSDVLAGMDQAIADSVDVISISMGYDGVPLYEDPVAIASFAAMERNVVVSTSAGERGRRVLRFAQRYPLGLDLRSQHR